MSSLAQRILAGVSALGLLGVALSHAAPQGPPLAPEQAAELERVFREQGVRLDLEQGVCAIDAQVAVRDELLEYFLCSPHGAVHESLFASDVDAEALNAALLTLGVEPGSNARWEPKAPQPSDEELRAGVSAFDTVLPQGAGLYLYATWREDDELFFYRAEDLVRDLQRGRTMKRHRWVYLGSRMVERGADREVVYAASAEGNLINIAFFAQGNTLLTAALEECVQQTIWLPNAWLVPDRASPVLLLFSLTRLDTVPESLLQQVPTAIELREGERR